MELDIEYLKEQAKQELKNEKERELIETMKIELRKENWLTRLVDLVFPFQIIMRRKK